MSRRRSPLLALALPALGCAPEGTPSEPLFEVAQVTEGGFTDPTDVVASPDGETFYFAALTDAGEGAIFEVDSEPGSEARVLAAGEPLVHPTGLVLSCDGSALYVADGAALYSLALASGALAPLPAAGAGEVSGLAMAPDCATLHVTGRTLEGEPALLTLPRAGGDAAIRFAGAPLAEPTGVHVDDAGVSWVMDGQSLEGGGALFAIPADGSAATPVLSGLIIGRPGGVSLISTGGTAVIPTRDASGAGQLTAVVIETGEVTQVPAEAIIEPAGIRTAREASVLAVVDAAGAAIYRAD